MLVHECDLHISLSSLQFSPPSFARCLFLAAVGDSSLTFTLLAPKKPYKEPNFKCSHNNSNKRSETLCCALSRTRTCHGPSSRLAPGPVASFGLRPGLQTCLGAAVLTQLKSNSRGQWSIEKWRGMRRGLSVLRRHLIACGISKKINANITHTPSGNATAY